MRKVIIENEKKYYIDVDLIESDKEIIVQVTKYNERPSNEIIYESKIKQNKLLELFGLSVERRLETEVRKSYKIISKHAYKNDKLKEAVKNIEEIFTLDDQLLKGTENDNQSKGTSVFSTIGKSYTK